VATISTAGLATGVALGTSSITAALGGVTSAADTLTVTAAILQSIAVTPGGPSVAQGLTQQFTARGTYSDGSTQDFPTQVPWPSSPPAVATISTAGVATGVALGSSSITAALGGMTSAAHTLTVTPSLPTLATGAASLISATGATVGG